MARSGAECETRFEVMFKPVAANLPDSNNPATFLNQPPTREMWAAPCPKHPLDAATQQTGGVLDDCLAKAVRKPLCKRIKGQ